MHYDNILIFIVHVNYYAYLCCRQMGIIPQNFKVCVMCFTSFSSNKAGYKQYLKSLGIENYNGIDTPFNAVSFTEFKALSVDKIDKLDSELGIINDLWYSAIQEGRETDELHLKMNARKLVREIERL